MERIYIRDINWMNNLLEKNMNKECITKNHVVANIREFLGSKNYVPIGNGTRMYVFLNEDGELEIDNGGSKLMDVIEKSNYFNMMEKILLE